MRAAVINATGRIHSAFRHRKFAIPHSLTSAPIIIVIVVVFSGRRIVVVARVVIRGG